MNAPDDLCFAQSHEWLRLEGTTATVGISDHAQQELTDIVYVELPTVGAEATAGETICVVESVKTASDIYAPISGKVTAVNDALTKNPGLVNSDPYGEGWIFKLEVPGGCENSDLLSAADYRALVGEH